MKKTKILSLAVVLAGATLTSCNDFLDAENKSAGIGTDEYFSNNEGINSAKAQAYYSLRAVTGNYELNCAGTDLYTSVRGKDPGDRQRYSLSSEDGECSSFYKNCYTLIQSANFYKEKAGENTVGDAEGKFLRQYAYYLLTQQFGGVPYLDTYKSDANRNYPKASLESIYDNAEAELEEVYNSNLLPETDYKGNASKQAVAALLAKYYLAEAWDMNTTLTNAEAGTYTVNSTENFKKAADWAVKAINGTQLTQTFEQKWAPSNEGNNEQIWSVQYNRAGYPGDLSSGGHGLQNMFGDYYGDPTKTGYKQVGSNGAMTEKALYLWQRGDTRYEGTFMTKMYNTTEDPVADWGKTGYYAYYKGDTANLNYGLRYFPAYTSTSEVEAEFKANQARYAISGTKFKNQTLAFILSSPAIQYTFKEDGTFTKTTLTYENLCLSVNGGTTVKKWDDPETECQNNTKLDYRDIVVFDLSDMYLVAAEAYLLAGNESEALNYVNAVRARANARQLSSFDNYTAAYSTPASFGSITPLDVILDESARELYGQFERWTQLRRTKQLVRYNIAFNSYINSIADMSNARGEVKWYRPIPQQAINSNYSLTTADQNPGY